MQSPTLRDPLVRSYPDAHFLPIAGADPTAEPPGAELDPRRCIRLIGEEPRPVRAQPAHVLRELPKIAWADGWELPAGPCPTGAGWEITPENVRRLAGHELWAAFSNPLFLEALGAYGVLDDHPLFQLRLDLMLYRQAWFRFRYLVEPTRAAEVDVTHADGRRERISIPPLPCHQLFDPQPGPEGGVNEHLRDCLLESCRDYVAGLTRYLLPGRELWGTDLAEV